MVLLNFADQAGGVFGCAAQAMEISTTPTTQIDDFMAFMVFEF